MCLKEKSTGAFLHPGYGVGFHPTGGGDIPSILSH